MPTLLVIYTLHIVQYNTHKIHDAHACINLDYASTSKLIYPLSCFMWDPHEDEIKNRKKKKSVV